MIRWLKALLLRRATHDCEPLPTVPRMSPTRELTDWDVALASDQPEPGRVEYRFLGVTGEEVDQ